MSGRSLGRRSCMGIHLHLAFIEHEHSECISSEGFISASGESSHEKRKVPRGDRIHHISLECIDTFNSAADQHDRTVVEGSFKLRRDALFLAVSIMDCCLAKRSGLDNALFAAPSLYVAAKDKHGAFETDQFLSVGGIGYSREQNESSYAP
ncbi:hypothetical protein BJ742DRAFT_410712 [Cladochytrium replicatum]|nr:hypothetical protein BJ742DRAFT_410712 [Cladochytrium replicatum]